MHVYTVHPIPLVEQKACWQKSYGHICVFCYI